MKRYLLASDFDQTLSFNDSGIVLSELLGISGFREKSAGLSRIHLVQQGAELAYLLLHDPEYRKVRKEHLIEVGKRIRLKQNLHLLPRLLSQLEGFDVAFYVISAAPQEVIQSALEGDRKSTRLNSSHSQISYAVFCLKKKNQHDPLLNVQIHLC